VTHKRREKKISGHGFERLVLGKHEMQKFQINLNSSFAACFANAVMAQPKDHDPEEPTNKWLMVIRNGISKFLGSPVSMYICTELPIDFLHSTDLLVVSWQHKSFVTVDLTTFEAGPSKADIKFVPRDLQSDSMEIFCGLVANMLRGSENRITAEMLALIPKNLTASAGSG